jgi:hypothetical protein
VAAGCGGSTSSGDTSITVRTYDGERLVDTRQLDCAAADGACARVVALLPRLRPRADEVCTAIYGGPERRRLTGRVDGTPLDLTITRVDGCQIARYQLLDEALQE